MAAAAFIAVQAGAASITWGTATWMNGGDGSSDVCTTGTSVCGLNVNGTDVTVASVLFASEANCSYIIVNGNGHTDFQDDNPTPSLDANYNTLMDPGRYQSTQITLSNLTVGTSYCVQVWSSDSRSFISDRDTVLTAGNAVTLLEDDGGATLGQWVTGTFTADADTQIIDVTSTTGADNSLINAVQVRAIPEAASVGMLGLGAGLILFARRYKWI